MENYWRQSLIPSFLYTSSSSNALAPSPGQAIMDSSPAADNQLCFLVASPSEPRKKIEMYSPEQDGDDLKNSRITTFSGIDSSYTLPKNVAIITLGELSYGKVLLRLVHLYEVGEDKDLSVMTTVELKKLFPRNKIAKVTETSLSANQERAEMERKRLVWKVEGGSEEGNVSKRGKAVDPSKLQVELCPMEIRTFIVELGQVEGEGFDA